MDIQFSTYYTLIFAAIVLLVGKFLVQRIRWLREFNIPEPVAGGLVAALISWGLNAAFDVRASFDTGLQTAFMLVFFSSIGLSANFLKLREGGMGLIVFLLVVVVFIGVQNSVGVALATALGLDPLIGLIAGSITLVGGHGTAGAWGSVLENDHGIPGAITLGIACATFGLVIGGLIGGPLAKWLIQRHGLKHPQSTGDAGALEAGTPNFEFPHKTRLITADAAIETMALFAGCLAFAEFMSQLTKGTALQLPTFVWALGGGVLIRNVLDYVFNFEVFDRAIDVFGNTGLSVYLAIALLSLKLWELAGLAGPLVIILGAQTLVMAAYAGFVTFRLMGSNYDAAVLCAGHCGFGMGATPTAVANMQAITNQYGASHKAFLIVPMVGAFFIDLVNAVAIQVFINVFG
ncbi:sodium/glutamate symporter [Diaphorobacter sp. ED-3]|uniref:sodium/glutamate symporter n=1 Tax=Diaphorobacter sp. ED-3 TaxID=3016636 RepID=UPI0022DDD8F4|nr:sodium/glutamate symporter [Diaphorobacter sp. ED-3]